jgi:hypothetical protein
MHAPAHLELWEHLLHLAGALLVLASLVIAFFKLKHHPEEPSLHNEPQRTDEKASHVERRAHMDGFYFLAYVLIAISAVLGLAAASLRDAARPANIQQPQPVEPQKPPDRKP